MEVRALFSPCGSETRRLERKIRRREKNRIRRAVKREFKHDSYAGRREFKRLIETMSPITGAVGP